MIKIEFLMEKWIFNEKDEVFMNNIEFSMINTQR